jgi:hypothetical protein
MKVLQLSNYAIGNVTGEEAIEVYRKKYGKFYYSDCYASGK